MYLLPNIGVSYSGVASPHLEFSDCLIGILVLVGNAQHIARQHGSGSTTAVCVVNTARVFLIVACKTPDLKIVALAGMRTAREDS